MRVPAIMFLEKKGAGYMKYNLLYSGTELDSSCSTHEQEEECMQNFWWESQKEINHYALRRLRRRWDGNIKMALREIGWGGMDWLHLAQDRD
jgi:hypothetical protein